MATPTQKQQPWLVSGPPCELVAYPVAATQTWGIGSPVYIKDGAVTLCVDCDGTDSDVAIFGFAAAAIAAPATGTEVYIHRISADQEWAIYVATNGADTAAAQDIIGDLYGHAVEATSPFKGYMTLDLAYTPTYPTNGSGPVDVSMRVVDVMSNRDTKIVASVSTSPGVAVVNYLQYALDRIGT